MPKFDGSDLVKAMTEELAPLGKKIGDNVANEVLKNIASQMKTVGAATEKMVEKTVSASIDSAEIDIANPLRTRINDLASQMSKAKSELKDSIAMAQNLDPDKKLSATRSEKVARKLGVVDYIQGFDGNGALNQIQSELIDRIKKSISHTVPESFDVSKIMDTIIKSATQKIVVSSFEGFDFSNNIKDMIRGLVTISSMKLDSKDLESFINLKNRIDESKLRFIESGRQASKNANERAAKLTIGSLQRTSAKKRTAEISGNIEEVIGGFDDDNEVIRKNTELAKENEILRQQLENAQTERDNAQDEINRAFEKLDKVQTERIADNERHSNEINRLTEGTGVGDTTNQEVQELRTKIEDQRIAMKELAEQLESERDSSSSAFDRLWSTENQRDRMVDIIDPKIYEEEAQSVDELIQRYKILAAINSDAFGDNFTEQYLEDVRNSILNLNPELDKFSDTRRVFSDDIEELRKNFKSPKDYLSEEMYGQGYVDDLENQITDADALLQQTKKELLEFIDMEPKAATSLEELYEIYKKLHQIRKDQFLLDSGELQKSLFLDDGEFHKFDDYVNKMLELNPALKEIQLGSAYEYSKEDFSTLPMVQGIDFQKQNEELTDTSSILNEILESLKAISDYLSSGKFPKFIDSVKDRLKNLSKLISNLSDKVGLTNLSFNIIGNNQSDEFMKSQLNDYMNQYNKFFKNSFSDPLQLIAQYLPEYNYSRDKLAEAFAPAEIEKIEDPRRRVDRIISFFNTVSKALKRYDEALVDKNDIAKIEYEASGKKIPFKEIKPDDVWKELAKTYRNIESPKTRAGLERRIDNHASATFADMFGRPDLSNIENELRDISSKIGTLFSSTDIESEGQALKTLSDVLSDVIEKIDLKTQAFIEERQTVEGEVQREIDALDILSGTLKAVQEVIESLSLSDILTKSIESINVDELNSKIKKIHIDIDDEDFRNTIDNVIQKLDSIPNEKNIVLKFNGFDGLFGFPEEIQGNVEEVKSALRELVDYMSHGFANSTYWSFRDFSINFFKSIKRDWSNLSQDLKGIFERLGMTDSNNNPKFKIMGLDSGGLMNQGGIIGDNHVVKWGNDEYKNMLELKDILDKAHDLNVQCSRIVELINQDQDHLLVEMQDTISGNNITNLLSKSPSVNLDFLNATEEQIRKFAEDLKTLENLNVDFDFYGDNIIFDMIKGFSVIDLSAKGKGPMSSKVLGSRTEDLEQLFTQRIMAKVGADDKVRVQEFWDKFADYYKSLPKDFMNKAKNTQGIPDLEIHVSPNLDGFFDELKDKSSKFEICIRVVPILDGFIDKIKEELKKNNFGIAVNPIVNQPGGNNNPTNSPNISGGAPAPQTPTTPNPKPINRPVLRQTNYIGDERYGYVEQIREGETHSVFFTWDEELGNFVQTLDKTDIKFEAVEKRIEKLDTLIENTIAKRENNIKNLGPSYNPAEIDKIIADYKSEQQALLDVIEHWDKHDQYEYSRDEFDSRRSRTKDRAKFNKQDKINVGDAKRANALDKAISKTERTLSGYENSIANLRATYDKSVAPGLAKSVDNQADLDYLNTQMYDSIKTMIDALRGTDASDSDLLDISNKIAKYKREIKIKLQANNPVKKEMSGQTLDVAISEEIAKYDKLIARVEKYGQLTADITEQLKIQRDILDARDPNTGKRTTTADQYYEAQNVRRVNNADFAGRIASNENLIDEYKKLNSDFKSARNKQLKGLALDQNDIDVLNKYETRIAEIEELLKDYPNLNDLLSIKNETSVSINNAIIKAYKNFGKLSKELSNLWQKLSNNNITKIEKARLKELVNVWQDAINGKGAYLSIGGVSNSSDVSDMKMSFAESPFGLISQSLISQAEQLKLLEKTTPEFKNDLDEIITKARELSSITDISDFSSKFVELKKNLDSLSQNKNDNKYVAVDPAVVQKEITSIKQFIKENDKMSDSRKESLQEIINDYEELIKISGSKEAYSQIRKRFNEIKGAMIETGEVGKSFFSSLVDSLKTTNRQLLSQYFSIQDWIRYFREAIKTVTEFDTALTEMRKVSNESLYDLKRYQSLSFDVANQVGTTALELQTSTSDWMRLGESLEDAAESAKEATILMNVSEFSSIDDATKSLVSMSQAYKDLSKGEIIDAVNKVGNEFSISTQGLAEALQVSVAVLSTQGNELAESIALITAGKKLPEYIVIYI